MPNTITCATCGSEKPEYDFYVRSESGRRRRTCKTCITARSAANKADRKNRDPEKFRRDEAIYMRAYRSNSCRHRATERTEQDRQYARDKARRTRATPQGKARKTLQYAVATGKLERPEACSECGIHCRPQAHHHDYSLPLDVVWLCTDCHAKVHRKYQEE